MGLMDSMFPVARLPAVDDDYERKRRAMMAARGTMEPEFDDEPLNRMLADRAAMGAAVPSLAAQAGDMPSRAAVLANQGGRALPVPEVLPLPMPAGNPAVFGGGMPGSWGDRPQSPAMPSPDANFTEMIRSMAPREQQTPGWFKQQQAGDKPFSYRMQNQAGAFTENLDRILDPATGKILYQKHDGPSLREQEDKARAADPNAALAEAAQRMFGKSLPEAGLMPFQTVTQGERAMLANMLQNQGNLKDKNALELQIANDKNATEIERANIMANRDPRTGQRIDPAAGQQAKVAEESFRRNLANQMMKMNRTEPVADDIAIARRNVEMEMGQGLDAYRQFGGKLPAGAAMQGGMPAPMAPTVPGPAAPTTPGPWAPEVLGPSQNPGQAETGLRLRRQAEADTIKLADEYRTAATPLDKMKIEQKIAAALLGGVGGGQVDDEGMKTLMNNMLQTGVPRDVLKGALETALLEQGMQIENFQPRRENLPPPFNLIGGLIPGRNWTDLGDGFRMSPGGPLGNPKLVTPSNDREFAGELDTEARKTLNSLQLSERPKKVDAAKRNSQYLIKMYKQLEDRMATGR